MHFGEIETFTLLETSWHEQSIHIYVTELVS